MRRIIGFSKAAANSAESRSTGPCMLFPVRWLDVVLYCAFVSMGVHPWFKSLYFSCERQLSWKWLRGGRCGADAIGVRVGVFGEVLLGRLHSRVVLLYTLLNKSNPNGTRTGGL